MFIRKIFNNNSILTTYQGEDMVLTGKGIGYGKKVGDSVDEKCIERKFVPMVQIDQRYQNLLKTIPVVYFELSEQIYFRALKALDTGLYPQMVVELGDHIYFAVNTRKDMEMSEVLLSHDVQEIYPLEYEIGLDAVGLINQTLGSHLAKDEASYIALHIVMAQAERGSDKPKQLLEFIHKVLDCFYDAYPDLERESENEYVMRFIVHLRYLGKRVLKKETQKSMCVGMEELLTKNPKLHDCLCGIQKMIKDDFGYQLNEQESMYLFLHMNRILVEMNLL